MNREQIQGNWKQITGHAKEQWGKLTDDDIDVVAGRRDQLAGKIQERYGIAKEEAESQVAAWQKKASDSWFKSIEPRPGARGSSHCAARSPGPPPRSAGRARYPSTHHTPVAFAHARATALEPAGACADSVGRQRAQPAQAVARCWWRGW
ncbi:MAG: CsbD family protein [Betaproteobacteria bacterium]|nr:CsbD family protein [Betaproteobacteria bacterium]